MRFSLQRKYAFWSIFLKFQAQADFNGLALKPWPNGLAKTCVQFAFCLATHLRGLASTCDDLR